MIIRVMGDGQYELSEEAASSLEPLDAELNSAIDADDDTAFSAALAALTTRVRSIGTLVAADRIVPSDLTLPHEGATVEDVRRLLQSEPEAQSTEPAPEGV